MLNLLKALRQDEHGVILSAEIVIVGTVLVIGLMTGLVCLQKSVNSELGDFAKAIDSIDQSYSFSGHRKAGGYHGTGNCCAFTAGSAFRNNECNTNVCQNDIVSCEGQMLLHSGSCGTCGSCGGQCGAGGVCGSCGLSGAACGDALRPDCVSTGVPNMKVTEYPGTSNVPRTSNAGRSPLRFPELEARPNVHQSGHPMGPGFELDSRPAPHEPLQGADHQEQFIEERTPQSHSPIDRHPPLEGRPHNGEIHPRGEFHQPGPRGPHGPGQPPMPGSGDTHERLRPVPQDQPLPETPRSEPRP